jgi:hypothetical protein
MGVTVTDGTTTPLRFQLLDDGVPIDLSGMTVTLLLQDRLGTVVSTAGMVTVITATTGRVDFTPSSASFFTVANSPYHARFKLVDASGNISFVPNSVRDRWIVAAQ